MTPKPLPSNGRARVLVVGAGIVGTCCALWLQRRGFAVTLLDRNEPGSGCSAGNAGKAVAEAMAGLDPSLDLSPFRVERFSAGQKLGKMALN